jgi:integrase
LIRPWGQLHVQRAVKEVTQREAEEERERGAEVYGNLVYGPTKTYERRRVTLPRWLATEVEQHLATLPASPAVSIFTTPRGEPIRQSNFYRRHFKPAVRAALPVDKHGLRFHDLRHSHASWLIAGGANVLQVMKRLGHRDIRTTLNTYGHVFPSDEEALAGMFTAEPAPRSVADLRVKNVRVAE